MTQVDEILANLFQTVEAAQEAVCEAVQMTETMATIQDAERKLSQHLAQPVMVQQGSNGKWYAWTNTANCARITKRTEGQPSIAALIAFHVR